MLLALNIGNSQMAVGLFDGRQLAASWRLTTARQQTSDELALILSGLLQSQDVARERITDAIVASVVPPLDTTVRSALRGHFRIDPLFVGPSLKLGMAIHYHPPTDVGADRIANAVAGYAAYGGPLVVVDLGTATTFDVVSGGGEYRGGIICPGLAISAEALVARTARLQRVEIRDPGQLVGTTTIGSIQSGLFYGCVSMVDGLLERLRTELGGETKMVATGGLAPLITPGSRLLQACDDNLTLTGLRLIWERNR